MLARETAQDVCLCLFSPVQMRGWDISWVTPPPPGSTGKTNPAFHPQSESADRQAGGEVLWRPPIPHQHAAPLHQGLLDTVARRSACYGHLGPKDKISPTSHPFRINGQRNEESAGPSGQRGPGRTRQREAAESTGYPAGRHPLPTLAANATSHPWLHEKRNTARNRKGGVLPAWFCLPGPRPSAFPALPSAALPPLPGVPSPPLCGPSGSTDRPIVSETSASSTEPAASLTLCFSFTSRQTSPCPHLVTPPPAPRNVLY